MSFNGSGVFIVNSVGQPVVDGTVISASAFNALTADLATGLTNTITKDGQSTTTARVGFAFGINTNAGAVNNPSIVFDGSNGAGFYSPAASQIALSIADTQMVLFSNGFASFAGAKVVTKASTTSKAGFNMPPGAAPAVAPEDGDMWTTTAGLFVRINGVTKTVTLT